MRVSQIFPSKYLRADDLADGEELQAVIAGCREEKMKDGQIKPVLYLDDDRALPLNATNARAIASKLGDESDAWRGHQITLFRSLTDYPNPDTPCLRVRVPQNSVKQTNVRPLPPVRDEMDSEIPF
jgi:hypothetical protein